MMNQGSNVETVPHLDSSLMENRNIVNANQGQVSSYAPSNVGSEYLPWRSYKADSTPTENGIHQSSTMYHYDPNIHYHHQQQPVSSSSSSLGTVNATQEYNGYAAYNPTDPYGYGSTGYSSYYNGYQQPPNHSYTQPVGGGQYQVGTGVPYQPPSFAGSSSYSSSSSSSSTTYYNNPGDYQTAGGYHQSSGYSNQNSATTTATSTNNTTQWNDARYANYDPQQYAHYTSGTSGVYGSGTDASSSVSYHDQYKQWAEYYNQTEVTCPPGTENSSVSGVSNYGVTTSAVASADQAPTSQPLPPPPAQTLPPQPPPPLPLPPPPPYPPSWRPDVSTSEVLSVQSVAVANGAHDGYWRNGTATSQNQHFAPRQPQIQKPVDQNYSYNSFQDPKTSSYTQGPTSQFPATNQVQTVHSGPPGPNYQYSATHQVPQESPIYQPPSQSVQSLDTRRVSKMQIPTNPRIASNFSAGLPKIDKDSTTTAAVTKPAYISVSLPKSHEKVSSSSTDSMLKPGSFPKSLRGYVERALARCKNDVEMGACQVLMKEMITKATADGTLHTRNWDVEPLFAMPNANVEQKDHAQSFVPISSLEKLKRSPTRRAKSRWEPLQEKIVETPASFNRGTSNYGGWSNEPDKKTIAVNTGSRVDNYSGSRFASQEQKASDKFTQKPFKRQRLMDSFVAAENADSASDSDKELNAYYAASVALADTPEERKRRESRSKRFEKGQKRGAQANQLKAKNAGTQNLYSRRATAVMLNKNFEDVGNRAVEDMDWDSLTVKGTCQEIEKRYLRLTSAPDPASVRPEEVLEKALLMVQNSQKNYLYKCDQLKSIRQDLTVQRIHNQLTVKVYETHARLALEVGDLPEYNQCQSQLQSLYAEGNEGCHMEFAAYNLLCVIMHSNNNRDLVASMSRLSNEAKKNDAVKHALAVRGAVTSGNYVMFFRLYKTAPNLNSCLMDLYVEKMRFRAATCMSRAYRPTLPVSYVARVLGFTGEGSDEKNSDGLEECVEWLKAHGACLVADNTGEMQLDAKAAASSLFMPEPEDAVAHGDSSLAVNDFLTRTS